MRIASEVDREQALLKIAELRKAIDHYDRSELQFEIGATYKWNIAEAPHNQGRRHGPMKCVYIGNFQGLLTAEIQEGCCLENRTGMYIVARGHLQSGALIKVEDTPAVDEEDVAPYGYVGFNNGQMVWAWAQTKQEHLDRQREDVRPASHLERYLLRQHHND